VTAPSYEQLAALVAAQERTIAQRQARIAEQDAELKRQLAASSRNSSKPPSSDGLNKPAPKSLRGRSGRKPGGQPGREGRTLRQVAVPDEVVVHEPGACAGCGSALSVEGPPVRIVRRQVFDIPTITVRVVEHRLICRRCGCGALTAAAGPVGIGLRGYGARVGLRSEWGESVAPARSSAGAGRFLLSPASQARPLEVTVVALPSASPTGPHRDHVLGLLVQLDLVTGRLGLVGRIDRATAHLVHDAISALLLTSCAQCILDLSEATVGDHHGLRAVAGAYRRATQHHRQLTLRGASPTLQRAALQLGGSDHLAGAGVIVPN
jgi:anti-anti-sigma regulatory factor